MAAFVYQSQPGRVSFLWLNHLILRRNSHLASALFVAFDGAIDDRLGSELWGPVTRVTNDGDGSTAKP
jgi:hypothetical protein